MAALSSRSRFITRVALFLALAVLLPIGFHALGIAGRIFLPMHIPVLLAGLLGGPFCGLLVGLMAPALSFVLTGMPPTFMVPLMSLELPVYGWIIGVAYHQLKLNIYIALIVAMVVGRLMFGLGLFVLSMVMQLPYTAAMFFSSGGALVTGLPGIALQIGLIPLVFAAIKRTRTH